MPKPSRPSNPFAPSRPLSPHQAEIDVFVNAAMDEDWPKLLDFLGKHPDLIDEKNSDGIPALVAAADMGREAVVRKLFAHGATVDVRDRANWTPLISAAHDGHTEIVTLLVVEMKADVNAVAQEGWTALMWACRNGKEATVRRLLELGADPNMTNVQGKTAAELACAFPEIIELVENWEAEQAVARAETEKTAKLALRDMTPVEKNHIARLRAQPVPKKPFKPGRKG